MWFTLAETELHSDLHLHNAELRAISLLRLLKRPAEELEVLGHEVCASEIESAVLNSIRRVGTDPKLAEAAG
jgi:hypothetical protein